MHCKRIGEILRALFGILIDHPNGLRAKDALAALRIQNPPTDAESGVYGDGSDRFDKMVRFATLGPKGAGWLQKEQGSWTVTSEGQQAYTKFLDPVEFHKELSRLYKLRVRKPGVLVGDQKDLGIEDYENTSDEISVSLETAEDQAYLQIEKHLLNLQPYEFQALVAALLRAMGYFTTESSPGPDGGIDIVAHGDALGVQSPRIKVQVKRLSAAINEMDLRPFLSHVNDGDVGIFVNTGGFGPSAVKAIRLERRKITLVDARKFLELWTTYYSKLDDRAREKIPLKPIWHLRNPEE